MDTKRCCQSLHWQKSFGQIHLPEKPCVSVRTIVGPHYHQRILSLNLFKAEGLTAMEAWVIACIVFVFAALMEYTGILLQVGDGAHDDIHGGEYDRVDDIHGGDPGRVDDIHGGDSKMSKTAMVCEQFCKREKMVDEKNG